MISLHKDLFPYQREGALWIAEKHNSSPNGFLADEMGLGKTPEAIAGADIIGAMSILVLCPGIARDNWAREFRHWQMLPRSICILRKWSDKPVAHVVVASYTILQSRPALIELVNRHWDLIICDEAHALKNHEALTTMIVYGADCTRTKGLGARADRIWLLSGTPMPNGPHEMWTHANACFPKAAEGLESYNKWLDRFCYWKQGDHNVRVLASLNVDEFVDRLRPYIKRRLVKDALPDLPPLRFGHVVVSPDKVPPMDEGAKEADTVLRAALASLKNDPSEPELSALMQAQQMHIASLLRWTGIAKAPAVAEAIRTDMQNGLKKLIVFARHSDVFSILLKQIPGSVAITGATPVKHRQPIIDAFCGRVPGKDFPVILLQTDIASTALTLVQAHDVAFAETGWVMKDVMQAVKRCHRIGQTMPVLAKVYALQGSVDEAVTATLVHKHRLVTSIETKFTG